MNGKNFLLGSSDFYFKWEGYSLLSTVNPLPNQVKSILLLNDVNLMQNLETAGTCEQGPQ